jgi:hypothetical protein
MTKKTDTECPELGFAGGYSVHNHKRMEHLIVFLYSLLKTLLHQILWDNVLLYHSEKE